MNEHVREPLPLGARQAAPSQRIKGAVLDRGIDAGIEVREEDEPLDIGEGLAK